LKKDEIFSKLHIRGDYKNRLERIMEKKGFSMDVRNLLLSMFYKMEIAYEDYKTVKQGERTKKEVLEEMISIIEKDCKTIELVNVSKPKKEVEKERQKINKAIDGKVISYPNELDLIYELYDLRSDRYKVSSQYLIFTNTLDTLLNKGRTLDSSEIIRDFDGWSWGTSTVEEEDVYLNLTYQNIRLLMRN